jgi:phage terminase large subunit
MSVATKRKPVEAKESLTLNTTKVYEANAEAYVTGKYRRALNEGGTSSSKTWSILQLLVLIAKYAKGPFLISIVSESLPHLKRGCIRDFQSILGSEWDERCYNKTEHVYTFDPANPKGVIEFFPADEPSKMRGGRRKVLFINEANNVQYEAFKELDIRTELFTFLDWNPVSEFWAHDKGMCASLENFFIHSTYMDALSVLPKEVIANIESNKDLDANWWRVYGLGLLGKLEHIIFPNWQKVKEAPKEYIAWGYGLDWGFAKPMALLKVFLTDNGPVWHEEIYGTNITNAMLIEKLSHLDKGDIWADPSRPDSIQELCNAGYNVYPANNDVFQGINLCRRKPIFVTEESTNLIKEVRNYTRKKDKDGNVLEDPVKINDHACDAGRYGTLGLTEMYGYATQSQATPKAAPVQSFRPGVSQNKAKEAAGIRDYRGR